jgi:hypothetical protein
MNLIILSKKLRQVSDLLNEILDTDIRAFVSETPETARRIIKEITVTKGKKSKVTHTYHGTHWTQQPENKAKLRAMMKKAAAARKAAKT